MALFEFRSGQATISQDMAGLLLCLGGSANMLINGADYNFSRGTLCIISPFLSIEKSSSSDDCVWEMICDNKDIFHSVAIHIFDTITKNNLLKNPCIQIDEKHIEEFVFFADKIKSKQRMLDKVSKKEDFAILRHNITLLKQTVWVDYLSLYFQERSFPSHNMSRNENLAYEFIYTLNQHYSEQRSVGWYADQAGLSPCYFSQIVHQYTGNTPTEWIKNTIIANAKKLLTQPKASIKEVAAELNFPDQVTFSKYFKKCTGMSPSQYRKSIIDVI